MFLTTGGKGRRTVSSAGHLGCAPQAWPRALTSFSHAHAVWASLDVPSRNTQLGSVLQAWPCALASFSHAHAVWASLDVPSRNTRKLKK